MDPHKKALLALKATARQLRYGAADEDDDLNELQPSEPADMKNPPLPQHFLEELPMPKRSKK